MSGKKSAIVGLGSAAMLVVAPQVALASNFGSTGGGGNPDNEVSLGNNRWHSYSFHTSGVSVWRTALQDASEDAYGNVTDVNTSQVGDNRNTDVRVAVGNMGTGFNGWVNCPDDGSRSGSDPNERCWNQWLKIDTSNAGGFNADRRKSLMCHEFGHTLGLRHTSSGSCMTTSAVNPNRSAVTDNHDRQHLNDNY